MNHAKPTVMVIGLGPIGLACARAIRAERDIKLVGLVDTNPAKLGKSLYEITGRPASGDQDEADLRIVASIGDVDVRPDIAVLTMTSRLKEAAPLLDELIGLGVSVVSSCEEMIWPWYSHTELAKEFNEKAVAAGVTILGTGVNPGFVMDLLPVTLASTLRRVSAVRCRRQVDASLRRGSLQEKIGVTLTVKKFEELRQAGEVGLVGLAQSTAMLAAGLGRQVLPGSVVETMEPVITDRSRPSALGLIGEGRVAGIHQKATWEGEDLHIEMVLIMSAGLEDPRDVIEMDGPVQIRMKIPGSLPGDSATVAAILNAIGSSSKWLPGLKTMLDVPPSGCHNRDWEPTAVS